MQRYHKEIISDEMRAKIKEYDRKKAAIYRLNKKLELEKRRETNNARKRKIRESKKIPTDLKKLKKIFTKMCKEAIKSKAMNDILVNSLSVVEKTHNKKLESEKERKHKMLEKEKVGNLRKFQQN